MARYIQFVLCTLTFCGCSSRAAPERTTSQITENLATSNSDTVPGYVHHIGSSRFRIGQGTSLELDSPTMQRWRGSLGAFALDPSNGAACALLDATSATGPYVLDETTHANGVKSYFSAAGLPQDQMGEIQSTFGGAPTVVNTTQPGPVAFTLANVTSIIRRRVSGILVVESEAWAKMTVNGDVDAECVFWPAISASTVAQAASWSSALADPVEHAAYIDKLPGAMQRDVGVVIHHTDMSVHSASVMYISYDAVVDTGSSAAVRHFDQNGVEFKLPQEQMPNATTAAQQKPAP